MELLDAYAHAASPREFCMRRYLQRQLELSIARTARRAAGPPSAAPSTSVADAAPSAVDAVTAAVEGLQLAGGREGEEEGEGRAEAEAELEPLPASRYEGLTDTEALSLDVSRAWCYCLEMEGGKRVKVAQPEQADGARGTGAGATAGTSPPTHPLSHPLKAHPHTASTDGHLSLCTPLFINASTQVAPQAAAARAPRGTTCWGSGPTCTTWSRPRRARPEAAPPRKASSRSSRACP